MERRQHVGRETVAAEPAVGVPALTGIAASQQASGHEGIPIEARAIGTNRLLLAEVGEGFFQEGPAGESSLQGRESILRTARGDPQPRTPKQPAPDRTDTQHLCATGIDYTVVG